MDNMQLFGVGVAIFLIVVYAVAEYVLMSKRQKDTREKKMEVANTERGRILSATKVELYPVTNYSFSVGYQVLFQLEDTNDVVTYFYPGYILKGEFTKDDLVELAVSDGEIVAMRKIY